MLIIMAHNITGTKPDGTSDYNVKAMINERVIYKALITGHLRDSGATQLLRRIADVWDEESKR